MNKIKGLIFDLDGVLVNTKKIHYEALNIALLKVGYKEISYNDHLNIYDGLPTTRKLEILTKNGSIEKKSYKKIKAFKQEATIKLLNKNIKFNNKIYRTFQKLSKDYKISLATNAVKKIRDIVVKAPI